jgi:hypothetical protein
MSNAATTQTSSASSTTGTPIPLTYGYVWATGKRQEYYELQNTGSSWMDYTRLGIWLLGHGEWDGPSELWINDKLTLKGLGTATTGPSGFSGQTWVEGLDSNPQFPALVFNFHSGCDATLGSDLTPSSSGPDQGVDVLFAQFPTAINALTYNRIAYYAIMRKQAIENQTSDHRNDPAQWGDIAPIGLWRALKCRLFDDEGNQTGYAFTTNPAWHFVDVLLRRKLYRDYCLDATTGPDVLTTAVKNRFDWGTIYESAQYFDEILANGRRRFTGNYSFTQQTSLQAVLEQILLCCRSFMSEYAGKIALNCDKPRNSVFTLSRAHILPGSWQAADNDVHRAANRYVANFRDLLVPQCSEIKSIVCANRGRPVVTTKEPHPLLAGDYIAIGGTDTLYDGEWEVYSVPDVINPGKLSEVDPSTFVLVSKGVNYPSSVGAVGGIGLLYSRFKERSPEFWHKQNMLARGAVGNGIARQREKVKTTLDFATTTWDQASRLTRYERDRTLGIDSSPYITPPTVKFRVPLFARDANGNLVLEIRPGSHVSLDDTINYEYAGEYEVQDLTIYPPNTQTSSSGAGLVRKPDESSGEIEFSLGPYDESIMYDSSDATQAGWPSVVGSDPGNDSSYTAVQLANGGNFVFFTGSDASGSAFDLPSTGYTSTNMLAWAGPQGYINSGHPMHIISLCSVAATRQLTLNYKDGEGHIWHGDVNYAALSWLSSDATTTSNGMTWLELILLGGETIIFGYGIVANGTTIELPSGYTTDKSFMVAYPHDADENSNDAHWVGAYVDSEQVAHHTYKDGEGHIWHGNAAVLIFAWKNNMSSWTTETLTGVSWAHCTLSNGQVFGVGCGLSLANATTITLPDSAGDGSSLQAIVGSSGWNYSDNGHPAHGIGACYLDSSNVIHIQFEDGNGNIWYGAADLFALYCTSTSTAAVLVSISPLSVTMTPGATQQFTATVANSTTTTVTWSVDGVSGGNVTVGTISSSGLYAAPTTAGTHTITATSTADTTASGTAAITINDTGSDDGGYTVTED